MENRYTPECPFCSRYIKRPEKKMTGFGEVIANYCACGAVYVCDPTGRNMGEAFSEALAIFTGGWDFDNLSQGDDYFIRELDYDLKNHRHIIVKGEIRSAGKLIFIHSKDTEIKSEVTVNRTERNLKPIIRTMLEGMDFQGIAQRAEENQAVISKLISMTYDKEDTLSWRAIESFRYISERLTASRQSLMRDTIRRLLWSMSDESGGIGWSACEILGAIISANPSEYEDVIPLLWSCREEEMFRAGTFWAMAQIAEVDPKAVSFVCNELPTYLNDKDPMVRANVALCMYRIRCPFDLGEVFKPLFTDTDEVTYYENGILNKKTVASFVSHLQKT